MTYNISYGQQTNSTQQPSEELKGTKVNWDNSAYLELKDFVSKYLEKRNYKFHSETTTKKIYTKEDHHILIVDQWHDPPEIWLGTQEIEKNNIRLGFILEYYLTGAVDLVKEYIQKAKSGESYNQFYTSFLDTYTSKIIDIDARQYYEFSKSNSEKIKSLAKELYGNK